MRDIVRGYRAALKGHREVGNRMGEGTTLGSLGSLLTDLGQLAPRQA